MNSLRLEKFEPAQHSGLIPGLTTLLHQAYAPLAANGMRYWASHQSDAETLHRLSMGESYLAFASERLVGTVNLRGPKEQNLSAWYTQQGVFSFHQFAICPSLQGKGAGSWIMGFVESRAKELGAHELALDTAETANHLIALYEKRGYRFIEYVQWEDANYRSVILSKAL